jgi:hypothetical protein
MFKAVAARAECILGFMQQAILLKVLGQPVVQQAVVAVNDREQLNGPVGAGLGC